MYAKPVSTGLFLVTLLAACAQQPVRPAARSAPSAASHPSLIDYARYITRPVGEFWFSRLYDWGSSDPEHVVVWVSPVEVYRLTLLGGCFDLQNAATILLTSHGGQVEAGLDSVIVRNELCTIQSIDKLDARAIKAARRAQRGGS